MESEFTGHHHISSSPNAVTSLSQQLQTQLQWLMTASANVSGTAVTAEMHSAIFACRKVLSSEESIGGVLINGILLRLSDLFRTSNNFVRFSIFKVFKDCKEEQLLKALNVGEIVRRFSGVLQSNDPIARAITLRTLGSIPTLLTDKLYVHHGLESKHPLEIDAAIFAVSRLCEISPPFAGGTMLKIAPMIEGIETSLPTKLKLIKLFRHMHHSPDITLQARKTCTKLLEIYPGRTFFLTVLDTLTSLAKRSLLDIPAQIKLLFTALMNDPRRSIKLLALKNLHQLALKAPHHDFNLEVLLKIVHESPYNDIKLEAMRTIKTLSSTAYVQLYSMKALDVCEHYLYDNDPMLSCTAAVILTNVTTKCNATNQSDQQLSTDSLVMSICAVISTKMITSSMSEHTLKVMLNCLTQLIQLKPTLANKVADVLVPLLIKFEGKLRAIVCNFVARILSSYPSCLLSYVGRLCDILKTEKTSEIVIYVCTSLFKIHYQSISQRKKLTNILSPLISSLMQTNQYWTCFTIARESFIYGYHELAYSILSKLKSIVESECFLLWLEGLCLISNGEHKMQDVTSAQNLISQGLTSVLASTSSSNPVEFQENFLRLKITFLSAVNSLRCLLNEPEQFMDYSSLHSTSQTFRSLSNSFISLVDVTNTETAHILQGYQVYCLTFQVILNLVQHATLVSLPSELATLVSMSVPTTSLHYYASLVVNQAKKISSESDFQSRAQFATEAVELLLNAPQCYPPRFFVRSKKIKDAVLC